MFSWFLSRPAVRDAKDVRTEDPHALTTVCAEMVAQMKQNMQEILDMFWVRVCVKILVKFKDKLEAENKMMRAKLQTVRDVQAGEMDVQAGEMCKREI